MSGLAADARPPGAPDEKPDTPSRSTIRTRGRSPAWHGPTYYGRSQLKEAPFNNWVVGGYIFLAGLSGSSATVAALARIGAGPRADGALRRARYLGLLAPTIGAGLLVWDLHTPQRFPNMMRVAKRTSPMSIGTWLLLAFMGGAMPAAGLQAVDDLRPGLGWPRRLAAVFSAPAALFGVGISTYTAALLASTSVPLWAASPRGLATRFASSSVAAGAAALSAGEDDPTLRRALDLVAATALAGEFAGSLASHRRYVATGVSPALESGWGRVERWGVNGVGVALPFALSLASAAGLRGTGRASSRLASAAILAGSLMLRVSMMSAGDVSARTPEISFRFAQPGNLPELGRITKWFRTLRRV